MHGPVQPAGHMSTSMCCSAVRTSHNSPPLRRSAHECRVRYHAHLHPRLAADAGRALTADEEAALLAAVREHGERDWPAVGRTLGLAWPPWRLLAAYRKLQARCKLSDPCCAWRPFAASFALPPDALQDECEALDA